MNNCRTPLVLGLERSVSQHLSVRNERKMMTMAKAREADLKMAMELCQALDALTGRWGAMMPEKIEQPEGTSDTEYFDPDDSEQCKRVVAYLRELAGGASLMRVVWGMSVLLDPYNKFVAPEADTLEHHPDTDAAKEDSKRLDWVMRNVTGLGWRGAGVEYSANCDRASIDAAMVAQGELVSG